MRDGDIRGGNAPLSPETPPACWPKPGFLYTSLTTYWE